MSAVYLVRHGQAGLRHNYDALSDLGRTQARLLGEYLASQNVQFETIYSGGMARQRETAEEVRSALKITGLAAPEVTVDARWNEFDLDAVFEHVAPRLSADDAQFKAQYEELTSQLQDDNSTVHRAWTPADTAIVRAWVEGRYSMEGETWTAFHDRISGAYATLAAHRSRGAVAVFTSATPMAIALGQTLGLNGRQIMRLAGVTYNASMTTLRVRDGDVMLFNFNNVPHLPEPHLRTFR